jgi:3-deoxy-D-manno-oct-2-ulosonic acid (Kdo) hydroxylase
MSTSRIDTSRSLDDRLERGEIVYYPACPFALPQGDDLSFLMAQTLGGRRHKNVSYDPATHRCTGFRWHSDRQAERLRDLLCSFADRAAQWLATAAPHYAAVWRRDRASLRPDEEATRCLRMHARNDLLHIDAFPNRPTGGDRILRLYANINPTDPRIWVTSDSFPKLLERYGHVVGSSTAGWRRVGRAVLALVYRQTPRTAYDDFMLRLHHVMKDDQRFQEKGRRRFWTFAPGSAWLAFTDGISHAELRGQFALEHTFFAPVESMVDPERAPLRLLERACNSKLIAA